MSASPLVSVILPTRDRAASLGRSIESVLGQRDVEVELLVVDDGSVDDTAGVLASFGGRIRVLRVAGAGPYVARNLGLRYASGELIAFADSDDAWLPHRLAVQLPLFDRAEVAVVYGDARHVGPASTGWSPTGRTCFGTTPPARGRVAPHLVRGNCVPTITVLARRSCLAAIGGFPTTHPVSADYLTWFRLSLLHEFDHVDEVVADYTVHEDGVSADLGVALSARIDLFRAELDATTDPAAGDLVRRLLFNLGCGLAVAAVRRRARPAGAALRRAASAWRPATARESGRWFAAYGAMQLGRRAARLRVAR